MGEIARWCDYRFEVSPELIRSFQDLKIKSSCETEEKLSEGEKFASRKNTKPTELSFALLLTAWAGCSVRSEALDFLRSARKGESGYFYLGSRKLLPFSMMLTDAEVSEVTLTPGGRWLSAKVQLTLRQGENSEKAKKEKEARQKPAPKTPKAAGALSAIGTGRGASMVKMVEMIK